MMLPSHLLGVLLLGGLLSLVRPLRARHWALALLFGVAIDLDHLLQVPAYVASHGLHGMSVGAMLAWGGAWQGFFHTPWALLPVLGAAVYFRSLAPPVFWGLHMFQDFVIARHYVVFGSLHEWSIVAVLFVLVVAVFALEWRQAGRAPWREHLRERFALRLGKPSGAPAAGDAMPAEA